MRYIAFLRGINIGGRKVIMEELQQVFEAMRFTNVKTLITSGNILFDSMENNESLLVKEIEESLQKQFEFSIPVILRTQEEIKNFITKDPFKNVKKEQGIRLQVTLFKEEIGAGPIKQSGYAIVYVGKREIGSVVYSNGKTTELMTFIDRNFGKNSTTRNWNTLQKLINL